MILVDSNVLIDLLTPDLEWLEWSANAVAQAGADDILGISPIVVAEVAPRSGSLDEFMTDMAALNMTIVDLTVEAAFAAGQAFEVYRERRRQVRETAGSVLPDFLIGGHALTLSSTILTRDPRFYRTYFPTVPLITPGKAEP